MKKIVNIKNFYFFLNTQDFQLNEDDDEDVFLKITNRNLFIENFMVGFKVAVYNGRFFIPFKITKAMVGHMFGALSFTRSFLFKKKKKKIIFYRRKKNI